MSIKQIEVVEVYDDGDTNFLGDVLKVELWIDGELVMAGNNDQDEIQPQIKGFMEALRYLEVGYVKTNTQVADTKRALQPNT